MAVVRFRTERVAALKTGSSVASSSISRPYTYFRITELISLWCRMSSENKQKMKSHVHLGVMDKVIGSGEKVEQEPDHLLRLDGMTGIPHNVCVEPLLK